MVFGILDLTDNKLILEKAKYLGYPIYFVKLAGIFKILGCLLFFWPYKYSREIKKWIYFGFFIELLTGFISHWVMADSIEDRCKVKNLIKLEVFIIS